MGGNIKGVTIEFRGETAPLEKALKTIDTSVKNIDKELRQVNNGLKFNPTSVTLWQQKQKLLTSKVKETEDRLKALKETQKKLDAKNVDKNSQEYRELQREIVTTESKLKTFRGQLAKVGNARLTALSNQLKQIGGKIKEVGTSLTKNVTAPLTALGGASIAAFKTVDEGLDIVTKKTGATGQALDDMKQSVKNLASEIPTDFATAGQAVGEVATRFQLAGQDLENLSSKFIKFASLNNTDVVSAVDQTQKALSAFGLSASDAGTLLDQLNKVGQDTGADMSTLLSGLIQNATGFQELGLSAQQAAVLMGQMETSGANSETVMQGLRKALKSAAKEGVPLDKALADLQNTILNGTDDMDGLTAAYDLFGKSGDQIYGAVKNGTLNFKDLGSTVAEAGNSIEETFNATLDPTDSAKMALNDLKIAGSELGATLLTTLAPAIEKVANFIQMITDKWNSLSPGTQEMIAKIGIIAAVLGPVLVVIGTVVSTIGSLIGVISSVIGVMGALAAPIGVVIAIVAAVIAVLVLLTKNWDKVKAAAAALGAKIKAVFDGIKTAIQNAMLAALQIIANIWNNIKAKIALAVQNIKTKVTTTFTNIKTTVSNIFSSVLATAKNTWTKVKDAIMNPIKTAKEKVKEILDKIKGFFPIKIGNLFGHIKLPHFDISWSQLGNTKLKIPHFNGINWYDKGGIFKDPSVIGIAEKRPEFVGALDDLRKIVREESGAGKIEINIYAAPGMDVNALAAEVERRIINTTNRRRLAW